MAASIAAASNSPEGHRPGPSTYNNNKTEYARSPLPRDSPETRQVSSLVNENSDGRAPTNRQSKGPAEGASPSQRPSVLHQPSDQRTQHLLYSPQLQKSIDHTARPGRATVSDIGRPSPVGHAHATQHSHQRGTPAITSEETAEEAVGLRRKRLTLRSLSHEEAMKALVAGHSRPINGIFRSASSNPAGWRIEQRTGRELGGSDHNSQVYIWEAATSLLASFYPCLPSSASNNRAPSSTSSTPLLNTTNASQAPSKLPTLQPKTLLQADSQRPSPSPSKDMHSQLDKISVNTARLSTEDTASVSSTTDSRTRTSCRECRTPGSLLTPLIPCFACGRGYHHSCGNPKPSKGAQADSFICGKCLRSQGPEGASSQQPQPASVYPKQPIHSLPTDHAVKKTSETSRRSNPFSVPETGQHPSHQDLPIQRTLGDVYKRITCPQWRAGACKFHESHCLYAHRDTGANVPSKGAPAKAFTCPEQQEGHCTMPSSECFYSHVDTGLYIDFNHNVSRKHITCWHWKVTGSCENYEKDCAFAHRDTGILAWQPSREAQSRIGPNSLKAFMCPRWELGLACKWHPFDCEYSHFATSRSCHTLPSDDRSHGRQSKGASSPFSPDRGSRLPSTPTRTPSIGSHTPNSSLTEQRIKLAFLQQSSMARGRQPFITSRSSDPTVPVAASIPNLSTEDTKGIGHHPFGVRHMAKRGGRVARPSLAKLESAEVPQKAVSQAQVNSNGSGPKAAAPGQPDLAAKDSHVTADQQKATNAPQANNIASSAKSVEHRVKKCEVCSRIILGSSTRCVGCAEDESRGQTRPFVRPTAVDKEIDAACIEIHSAVNGRTGHELPEALAEEPSQRPNKNVRKRTTQDDQVFIRRKILKPTMPTQLPGQTKDTRLPGNEALSAIPFNGTRWSLGMQPSSERLMELSQLESRLQRRAEEATSATSRASLSTDHAAVKERHGLSNRNGNVTDHQGESGNSAEHERLDGVSTLADLNSAASEAGTPQGGGVSLREMSTKIVETDNASLSGRSKHQKQVNSPAVQPGSQLPVTNVHAPGRPVVSTYPSLRIGSRSDATQHSALSTASSSSKSGCTDCASARRECLHKPGGLDNELDPLRCIQFLQGNPKRPGNGNFSEDLWVKIQQAARVAEAGNTISSIPRGIEFLDRNPNAIGSPGGAETSIAHGNSASVRDTARPLAPEQIGRLSSPFTYIDSHTKGQIPSASRKEQHRPFLDDDSDDEIPLAQTRLGIRSGTPGARLNPAPFFAPVARRVIDADQRHSEMLARTSKPNQPNQGHRRADRIEEDDQRALDHLRRHGVRIEAESDADDRPGESELSFEVPPLITDPLHHVQSSSSPFDVDLALDLRNPENRYVALGIPPPWKRDRPTKKQLMGKLLEYQCRENKYKFGNPHMRVLRKAGDTPVTTFIEPEERFLLTEGLPEANVPKQKVQTNFREFFGIPKNPIITSGRTKEELVFVDGVNGGTPRSKRYRDDERFPFVY